jgi:hypothetical protein
MATRSRIGLMLENGTIKHSYCHWDGYPTGVGKTLVEHYSNIEKVKEAASAAGFHSFRVATYNGEAPNFAKAVTV